MSAAGFILLNYDTNLNEWLMLTLTDSKGFYDIPKGVLDRQESYLDAAKRELFEETNIDIDFELNSDDNLVKKTWFDWDSDYKEYIQDPDRTLNDIAVTSASSDDLFAFICEVDKHIFYKVKLLPNPKTNAKEHMSFKFVSLDEFESIYTPSYLKYYFRNALNKIYNKGERRGF